MSVKIGNTNIKSLYLGNNELQKIYLGSNLIYQKSGGYVDTEFSKCPFPTSWTSIKNYTKYSKTNEYGTWIIEASSTFSGNYPAKKAFNNVTDDYWFSTRISDNDTAETIEISLPTNVLINPTTIYIMHLYQGNTSNSSKIQGYNPQTNLWEDLGTLDSGVNGIKENTFTISNNIFYSKFRALCYRFSSSYDTPQINEFQVKSGTVKEHT